MSFRTIPQMFFTQVQRFGERRMLLVKREGSYREMRWSEVGQAVEEVALCLWGEGIAPGQRVAILSENRPEWPITDLAIQTIRAITVPIYPTDTPAEVAHILEDSGAVAVIVSTEAQVAKVLAHHATLPQLRRLILMDALERHAQPTILTFAQCLAQGRKTYATRLTALRGMIAAAQPADTATIIYTSGTTGEPKGVMLSHANFLSNCAAGSQALRVTEHDVHLSFLPLSHVFERMAGYYLMLHQGATIAYAENMDTVPHDLLEVKPTVLLGVPRFYEKLYARVMEAVRTAPAIRQRIFWWAVHLGQHAHKSPLTWLADRVVYRKLNARVGGRVRFCVSGSAPLSKEIAEFFAAVGLIILEGYGLTETSPVISVNRLDAYRFGSVGQPIADVEVRIADDGEILTRGPHIMQGYYQKETETRAVLREGWLHTGDIGHVDHEGFLYITDRKKDLIKTAGGKMVAPQKIENLLVTDPYIAQAFVFGDRERYLAALIVPRFEALKTYAGAHGIPLEPLSALLKHPQTLALIQTRIDAHSRDLASYERIKQFALLEQEWSQASGELTPTLKARRAVLARKYAAVLERLYAAPPEPSART